MRKQISVIGAGKTGAATAQRLAERDYADITLFDVIEGLAEGTALDLYEAGPVVGYDTKITGVTIKDGSGYDRLGGSDIIIMTGGIARKPGMSRDDLVRTNVRIMQGWAENTAKYAPDSILIILTNPVDGITQYAHHVTRFPKQRVIGQAGVLDSARFRTFIAMELKVSVRNVDAYVLGSHGDAMVPLPHYTTVAGVPLPELLPADRIEALVKRTRDGGAEIVNLLKTGSAYYAPSASIAQMVDAIVYDKKQILPCCVLLEGEYGINGVFAGVPVKVGAGGAEQVVPWKLSPEESAALVKSAEAVKALWPVMGMA